MRWLMLLAAMRCADGGTTLAACGGSCPDGEFCAYSALCGAGDENGSCRPIPADCPAGGHEVCGCDGQTWPSACAANQAEESVADTGGPC